MSRLMILLKTDNQSGAIAILTAIMLTMFIGFAALAIDTGHLVVTKNELQNAADAGALAGANALYSKDGTAIQIGCNQIAHDIAESNLSDKIKVELDLLGPDGDENEGDVQRGHWSFTTRTFTPNDSTDLTDLTGKTADELDVDLSFINAVQVTISKDDIISFFARIWEGNDKFLQSVTAVAFIGFAGTFAPGELEIPIALCSEVFYPDGTQNPPVFDEDVVLYQKAETAMWTNMQQSDDPSANCPPTNADIIKAVVGSGNPGDIYVGVDMGVTNGITSVLPALIMKWETETIVNEDPVKRKVWRKTFPVIECFDAVTGSEENTCARLVGGVEIEILWIIDQKFKQKAEYEKAPYKYYESDGITEYISKKGPTAFECTPAAESDDALRMAEFTEFLGLPTTEVDKNGNVKELDKRVFFSTSFSDVTPAGGPGGINTGVLSARAVLVK